MRRVLVTHLDSPVGRRLALALCSDPDVALVLGTGMDPRPDLPEALGEKCVYRCLDLTRARPLAGFFRSPRFVRARVDSVVHLPFVRDLPAERIRGGEHALVSETRGLVQECRRHRGIERFLYLSSAFVYRPEPGNVNLFDEEQPLGWETGDDPAIRAWIDADRICQKELGAARPAMTILRAATIVTASGDLLQSPPVARGGPLPGFDPMLAVVADRDVVRALLLALHADRPGIYNIAGSELFPCSRLCAGAGRPGPLRLPALVSSGLALLRRSPGGESAFRRYGIALGTRRAREVLGFEPCYRVEVRGRGRNLRIDTVRI